MNSIIIIGSAILIAISVLSTFFNVVQIFGDQQQLEEQQQGNNNRTANIDKQLASLDMTILEGLTECSDLENDNCIAKMETLDRTCQSIYSEYCFGSMWDKFVEYKQELINEGHLAEYEDDSYYNLNNDHYGNSSMEGNISSRDLK